MIGASWTDAEFQQLFNAIAYRGPDDSGMISIGSLRLGMHRLHLRGQSHPLPILTENGYVAFNGQVYGIHKPDGSVICAAPGLINEVTAIRQGVADGMYAVVFVEKNGSELLLKTDPQFVKPLFYAQSTQGIAFCSEMAPLLPLIKSFGINRTALAELFTYGWYLNEQTWINEISIVIQHDLRVKGEHIHKQVRSHMPTQYHDALPTLRNAVRDSIRRCIDGTGPFGLALSGGLDSTILAWELNALGVEDIHTISIMLPENQDGVENLASLGLPRGGSWRSWNHHVVKLETDDDFVSAFQTAAVRFGQPTTMSSLPLVWRLSETAAEVGIRVMLTGEGVDELFCGYGSYAKVEALQHPLDYYRHPQREALVNLLFGDNSFKLIRNRLEHRYHGVSDLRYVERDLRLARLLLRNDICFMNHSIEGRVPFLHNSIPNQALRTPWKDLVQNGGKASIRAAWREELGVSADRPKTRLKASDQILKRCIQPHHLGERIKSSVAHMFNSQCLYQCMDILQSDSGFDADIASLLISLCFIQEQVSI